MEGHTPGDEFDHIPRLDDGIGVKGLLGSPDSHGALEQVELELNAALHQSFLDDSLALLNVLLAILREEDAEAALLEERLHLIRFDLVDFPVVDVIGVPRLVLAVILLGLALGFAGGCVFVLPLCC